MNAAQKKHDLDLICIALAGCRTGPEAIDVLLKVETHKFPALCEEAAGRDSILPIAKYKLFQITEMDALVDHVGIERASAMIDKHFLPFSRARTEPLSRIKPLQPIGATARNLDTAR